ncbi:flagellar basal body P-ring formation chaperone FlgA [Thermosipho atlanticus]|uniref:Flagella basal body P-ring formation protein FlgA n=1 Tax=Thermosipho atlanticus DSM 15807 TaxID=1123380 RepID=A0A1M5T5Q3_9BACT|nr:flagellar basal body P-ring formation chaperone FlgA [Thermosipho atlanticus]SHH46026.1 flagella basal body P-ring formation protein FlgA [Thermosipho atlanticus DSM 15807]
MIRKILIVIFCLVLSTVFSVSIEFLLQSTVTTNVVTVFDVAATFTGIDETILKDLKLVYLPDNASYDIDVRYILMELSKVATDIIATPTSGTIWVSNVKELYPSTLTEDLAQEIAIQTILSKLPPEAEATITTVEGTITRHDKFSVNVIDTKTNTYFVRFSLLKEEMPVGYYDVTVYVKNIKRVFLAARKINYGEIVTEKDLIPSEINDYSLFGTVVDLSELPMIAKKDFEVGEPVFREYLQPLPYVVKGQIVEGYVKINNIVVKTKYMVLENGNLGDAIKAENMKTKEKVVGIVEEGPLLHVIYKIK